MRIDGHDFFGEHSDNILSKFQPIWPGAADLELKMHVQLTYFFFQETEKS